MVSQVTQRLESWVASALWSQSELDEGTPMLAQEVAGLLGARALLLLLHQPGASWQPEMLVHPIEFGIAITPLSQGANAFGASDLTPELIAPDADSIAAGAVPRDSWSRAQADFVASALALIRPDLAATNSGVAAPVADQSRLQEVAVEDADSSASTSTIQVADASDVGATGVLDSANSVGDWMARSGDGGAWQSAPPSLLLMLPSSAGGAPGGEACGAVLAWIESEDGLLSDEWRPVWSACARQAGAWLEGAMRLERVGRSYRDLAHLTARVVDARDAQRVGHGPLVAHACVLMAQALGLDARQVEEWEMAGLLHGIGRVPVPDSLLQQSSLSPTEREVIRSSMLAGAGWLGEVEGWSEVALIVRHAGERWDGRGFPDALGGEAIPQGSRALAIASRFAALSQARPERGALGSLRNVGVALESEAGRALDPRLTTLFLRAMRGPARS